MLNAKNQNSSKNVFEFAKKVENTAQNAQPREPKPNLLIQLA